MYRKEKAIALKGSTSSLCNNLSIQKDYERPSVSCAVVHRSVVNMVIMSPDGSGPNHRQVVFKEPHATISSTFVLQAKLVQVGSRSILVSTSRKGIQMNESDGSVLLFWHSLEDQSSFDVQSCFGRGICTVGNELICVGLHTGLILVFKIPPKGNNITLQDELKGHTSPICDLAADKDKMVSSDDDGNIKVWQLKDDSLQRKAEIKGAGLPCSTIALWEDVIVGGYASGHIRLYNANTGSISAEVTAHARWVNAVSVAQNTGLMLSASEDSFVRVWQLEAGQCPKIQHKWMECVTDQPLVGASFIDADGQRFCLTSYDNNEMSIYVAN